MPSAKTILAKPSRNEERLETLAQPAETQAAAADHEIAQLAYSYWEAQGCPSGTAIEDWLRAERDLQELRRERQSVTNLAEFAQS
jgi:hypothetical protein